MYRYIFLTLTPYVLIGITIFSLINLIQYLKEFIDLAVQHGAPIFSVLKTVFYLIPFLMTFTIPVGLFLGIILALGKMGSHNEILAMKAGGIKFSSLYKPCLALGLIIFIFQLCFFEWVLPWGNTNFIISRYNIIKTDPMAEIKKKKIFQDGSREIRVTDSDNDFIYGVYITDKAQNKLFYASKASVVPADYYSGVLLIKLIDVSVVPYVSGAIEDEYYIDYYKNLDFGIKVQKLDDLIPQGAEIDKVSVLYKRINSIVEKQTKNSLDQFHFYLRSEVNKNNLIKKLEQETEEKKRDSLSQALITQNAVVNVAQIAFKRAENTILPKEEIFIFHRKIAFSANSIIMALIAIPLAIFKQRKGKEVSILGSVFIIVIYNIMLVGMQIIYLDLPISGTLAAWLPSMILFGIAVALFFIKAKKVS